MTRAPFHLLKEGIYRQMILERQCQACYLVSDAWKWKGKEAATIIVTDTPGRLGCGGTLFWKDPIV